MSEVVLNTIVTCPECGVETETTMPTDRCEVFWACPACNAMLRPEEGDCCVFCTYGRVPCPPVQTETQPPQCGNQ